MKPAARDEAHLLAEHLVGDLLVDGPPEPLVPRLRRDGERPLALPGEDREELLGDRVDLDRGEGDVETEPGEAVQDRQDLGVVADGGRDQADAGGQRPAALGDLEDARGGDPDLRAPSRRRPSRSGTSPSSPARSRSGACPRARCAGVRIVVCGRLARRARPPRGTGRRRPSRSSAASARVAVDGRDVEPLQGRERLERSPSRSRPGAEDLGDAGDELLAVPHREDVDVRGERRGG